MDTVDRQPQGTLTSDAPPQAEAPLTPAEWELARRYQPILRLLPDIGPRSAPDYLPRPTTNERSPRRAGPLPREYYPRDVRLILEHAQAWEPNWSLPFIPLSLNMAYRDLPRLFFLPIVAMVTFGLLVVALAQAVDGQARAAIEIGALVVFGVLYLFSLRSPVLEPTSFWHTVNHLVVAIGLILTWNVTVGGHWLWIVAPAALVPSLITGLSQLARGFMLTLLQPVFWLATNLRRWVAHPFRHGPQDTRPPIVPGFKPEQDYSRRAEMFFRPFDRIRALRRFDRAGHWEAYARLIEHRDYPPTVYARLVGDVDDLCVIQYWLCYYYDDWGNSHECDWEFSAVVLRGGEPVSCVLGQHEAGEHRAWHHVERQGDRPVLYVAVGSHATYFAPGTYPGERQIGGLTFGALEMGLLGREVTDFLDVAPPRRRSVALADAQLLVIPEPEPKSGLWDHDPRQCDRGPGCRGTCRADFRWLNYPGHWGAAAFTAGDSAPKGPAFQNLRWTDPLLWATLLARPCRRCDECAPELLEPEPEGD